MKIDWEKIKKGLPKTAHAFADQLKSAHEADPADSVRSIDKALREKLAGLRTRFDALRKEVAK